MQEGIKIQLKIKINIHPANLIQCLFTIAGHDMVNKGKEKSV